MSIEKAAKREVDRMKEVLSAVKLDDSKDEEAKDFLDFARNYQKDSIYFYEKKQFVEAFEAAIIAWAYVDIGLKLGIFSVPKEQEGWFTA